MEDGESSYRRFLAGDDEGLLAIIRAYRPGLILYLHSIVQDIHTAEELTEDVFWELMVKRPRFAGNSTFKTWLYAIGRHLALRYIRKHAKLSVIPLASQAHLADEADLEREYIKSEEKRMLHKALHELDPKYRQVLYLVYFEELSSKEVGIIMKRSDKQIRDLLYHAKRSLRAVLERSGFRDEE